MSWALRLLRGMKLSKYIVCDSPEGHKCIMPVDENESLAVLGVPWREAKKQLRAYYLEQARKLRSLTEKDVNPNA